MLRVEPLLIENYVAAGTVKLRFNHVLDHGGASERASAAAECAGQQDPYSFWTMHNHLFENISSLFSANVDTYVGYADSLGLDTDAFGSCMADPAVLDKIRAQHNYRTNELNIRRRPAFLINDSIYQGGLPFDAFERAIADAMN